MLSYKAVHSLVKVFSDEKPGDWPSPSFSMLANERASFQVVLHTENPMPVSVAAKSPLSAALTMYSVEEVPSDLPAYKDHDDYVLRDTPGLYPDVLRPLGDFVQLDANKYTAVWIEIHPDRRFSAGTYPVAIEVKGDDGSVCACEITVELLAAELPEQTLIYTNWFHTDCLATRYGVPVFSPAYWEITRAYLKTAVEHGMNMVLTPLFTPPLDTQPGGERPTVQLVDVTKNGDRYEFGFDKLRQWVSMCLDCGVEYFEMSHLFSQWGAKYAPKIVATVNGTQKTIFGWHTRASSRQYKEFLTVFAGELDAFLADVGIKERCWFHVSDEPFVRQYRSYKNRSDLVKTLFPDYPVIDALSDFTFYARGAVQTPIPAVNHIEPFAGKVPSLWTYYCCSQHKDYVPNRFFSMPSLRNRVLGVLMYKYDVHGFLQWGYNFWYSQLSVREIDPFTVTDAGKAFPSGDAFVVYPGENGTPLLSLRLKVFYEALQDMRALQLLEQHIGRDATEALLEEGLEQPLSFTTYPREDAWLLTLREKVNARIQQHS